MYRSICIPVLLIAAFALIVGRTAGSQSASLTSPVIVARGRLINQTSTFPTRTIFTPQKDGLYRLSIYATLTKADENSNSTWESTFEFTDDAGAEASPNGLLWAAGNARGQFVYLDEATVGGATYTFQAKADTAVTQSMTQIGPPDNSAYSMYWVVEKLI